MISKVSVGWGFPDGPILPRTYDRTRHRIVPKVHLVVSPYWRALRPTLEEARSFHFVRDLKRLRGIKVRSLSNEFEAVNWGLEFIAIFAVRLIVNHNHRLPRHEVIEEIIHKIIESAFLKKDEKDQ